MKQFKKLIACVLAATLVLGSTTVVFGADNSQTGSLGGEATLEGTVNREVFSVEAPTIQVTGGVYDFKLDPEGLIEITSGGKYTSDGIYFLTPGSMYFQVSDDAYDVNSQKATVTNKSSVDVTVTLNATVTVGASNAAITFDEDGVWAATDTSLGIYLAIKGEDQNSNEVTGAAIVADGDTFKGAVTTDLASFDAYTVQVSGEEYVYAIDPTKASTVSEATYTFWLTGACNTNAKWSDYDTTANPTIDLVWTVKVKQEAEVVEDAAPTFTTGDGLGQIKYTVGSGDLALASIESINMTNDIGTFDGYNASEFGWSAATKADGVITMDATYMGFYNANAKTTATITYKTVGGETKTATVDVISK